jgi:hypothetical protein
MYHKSLMNPGISPLPRLGPVDPASVLAGGFAITAVVSAVGAFLLLPTTASAGSMYGKHPLDRPWHGYGFLPGYEPPEVVEWRNARIRRPAFWYGGPGFYRGRWNGGGFGPCWTPTPIGPHWNCG